jgi:telomerase reverse transcriptase
LIFQTLNSERLGSALFSVGDLDTKLKSFKSILNKSSKPLYFVKVDVQAAFDTIPQIAVLKLMSTIPTSSTYRISKHVEIKAGQNYGAINLSKPIRKWKALAQDPTHNQPFEEHLESSLGQGKKDTIFVENIVNQFRDRDDLLELLREHVQCNMVSIGKKFYRQKEGIPQGSVLSSLLCNYFYADLEATHLNFLQKSDSLLLRLIDDFLLITLDRNHAKRFLRTMHDGLPEYGVRVNPAKTLVNFEVTTNGRKIERLVATRAFPYCGTFIDTKTLDVTRNREKRCDLGSFISLVLHLKSNITG